MIDTNRLYLALLHHPVCNRAGEVITSAVTNLDLHDIARASKTYGVAAFFVVTPLRDQQELVQKIIAHWTEGVGGTYNPDRKAALELIRVVSSLDEVKAAVFEEDGAMPVTIVTDARSRGKDVSFARVADMLGGDKPLLILFGTAWGLTEEFMEQADYVLSPIKGPTDYNHLSVRSAAAIVLDRLLGKTRKGGKA